MRATLERVVAGLSRPPRQGGCTARTPRCDFWNWGDGFLRPDCCTDHLKELTFFAEDLLTRHGILHWVDFGTLLGAVREQSFIPWDEDVDFGVLERDKERVLALEDEIAAAGFHLDMPDPTVIQIQYSPVNVQHVEFFLWAEDAGRLRNDFDPDYEWPGVAGHTAFPAEYIDDLGEVTLYGQRFPAPSPLHEFLAEHRYGPDYMTPRRPVLSVELSRGIGPDDMTPRVDELLGRLAERDHRVSELKTRSRLATLGYWQRWVDAGLPIAPAPRFAEAVASEVPADERTPAVERLVDSVALLDQAIDEYRHPSAALRLKRAGRRMRRAARALAERVRGRS